MNDDVRAAQTAPPSVPSVSSARGSGGRATASWYRSLELLPVGVVALVVAVAVVRPRPFADDGGLDTPSAGAVAPVESAVPSTPAASASSTMPSDELAAVLGGSAAIRAAEEELAHRLRINDLKGAIGALEKLLEISPNAVRDGTNRERVVDLAMRAMFLPGDDPDRVFALVATKMGPAGIDVLYQLATTKGGSKAAKYAERLLDDPRLLSERGSPSVGIAWELYRTTDCEKKKALFPRAAEFGDARTLGQLRALGGSCGRMRRRAPGACCMSDDPELESAVQAIEARVRR